MKFKRLMRKLFQNKMTYVCCAILMLIVLAGILAPLLAPHDPLQQHLEQRLAGPSMDYPLGTDQFGRCILSRILFAARATLGFAILCTLIAACIGIFLGTIAGFKGGIPDSIIMRMCDVLYAFPGLVIVMAIVGFIGVGIVNVVIAMLVLQWLWYARVSRNLVMSEKNRSYISAAKMAGFSDTRIIFKHILPNIIPNMLAIFTVDFGHTIIAISGYSFLGLGVQPPQPEWGAMINEGRNFLNRDPLLMLWPGIMILVVVVSANILGDKMRDAMDN